MANPSPLNEHFDQLGASFVDYGEGVQLVGEIELTETEYGALRKSVGMLDGPHRGLLKLSGADHLDFLHRMLSGDCNGMEPGEVRRMFMLTAKGRITADILVVHQGEQTLLDTDVHQAQPLADELDKLLFAEDVTIENLTQARHRVSLHGPRAEEVVQWWRRQEAAQQTTAEFHYDEVGVPGWHIWAEPGALRVFAENEETLKEQFGCKPIGWLAYNIARIEAGCVMFNVDFGSNSLPHETGRPTLDEAVNFEVGCYRGQEVVARMESLGHPSKVLVGFRSEGEGVPLAGAPVTDGTGQDADTVGAVTSSTYSPMLGHAPIGFAMIKWVHREPGTQLYATTEEGHVPISVQPLKFYEPSAT